jgi:hypothetical protein
MATFETNNPGFNPETATQIPNVNNLQAGEMNRRRLQRLIRLPDAAPPLVREFRIF